MALVKPITLDVKGAVTTYYKVLGYGSDFVTRSGVIYLGAYFSRQSREANVDPYRRIELPLQGKNYLPNPTVPELYVAIKKNFVDFADAIDEETPAPARENFPEIIPGAGLSESYEKAKQKAEEEKLKELD